MFDTEDDRLENRCQTVGMLVYSKPGDLFGPGIDHRDHLKSEIITLLLMWLWRRSETRFSSCPFYHPTQAASHGVIEGSWGTPSDRCQVE